MFQKCEKSRESSGGDWHPKAKTSPKARCRSKRTCIREGVLLPDVSDKIQVV